MKKLLVILAALLIIPSVLAISTDLKPIYSPGETLIAEIAGNILQPINRENVELKRQNVQVPWEYDIKRIGDKYFLYGVLPNAENNYTLHIRDITTTVNGIVTSLDFNQSFSTQGDSIAYSIKPGFAIIMGETEFRIFLNRDFPEPITINFPEDHGFTLQPGENTITFTNSGVEPGFVVIQIGIYSVPVFILAEDEQEIQSQSKLRFFPRNIESTILFDQSEIYPFSIINDGDSEIRGLEFQFDPQTFILEPLTIEFIGPGETLNFNLSLKNQNEPIDETIILQSEDFLIEFPVLVEYTENIEEVETAYFDENYSEAQGYYCSELGGKSCTADELCSTSTVSSLDIQNCCLGTCSVSETGGGSLAWIGWSIGTVILIILVIVGARYYKSKKHGINPLKKKVTEMQQTTPTSFSLSKKP